VDVKELRKLDAYLKRLFHDPGVRVVPRPKRDDLAEVYRGGEMLGILTLDDEDGERSFNFRMDIALSGVGPDAKRLDAFFKQRFPQAQLRALPRPRKQDSMDVHAGDEFVGVLFVEDKGGGGSYVFEMSILDIDLEDAASA
jgi:hypothetical protein